MKQTFRDSPSVNCVRREKQVVSNRNDDCIRFFFFKVIFLYVWFVELCYYNNKSNDIAKIFQNTHPIFIIIFFFKLGFFLSIKWRWRKRICIQQVKSVQRKTGKFCSSTDFILLSNCAHCFRSCFFFSPPPWVTLTQKKVCNQDLTLSQTNTDGISRSNDNIINNLPSIKLNLKSLEIYSRTSK